MQSVSGVFSCAYGFCLGQVQGVSQRKWVFAIYKWATSPNGVSTKKSHRDIKVTLKAAVGLTSAERRARHILEGKGIPSYSVVCAVKRCGR